MLSSLVKEHQARQVVRKEQQEGKKKEAPTATLWMALTPIVATFTYPVEEGEVMAEEAAKLFTKKGLTLEVALIRGLVQTGAVKKLGPPPRWALERAAQDVLTKNFSSKDQQE